MFQRIWKNVIAFEQLPDTIKRMRKEAKDMWDQAIEDLKTAEVNLQVERFYASVFFSHQAAEKVLNAVGIIKQGLSLKGHNLLELSITLNATDDVKDAARELTPDYVQARYPDAANGVPARLYSNKNAVDHLEYARRVITWCQDFLK